MSRAIASPKPGRAGILIARMVEPVEGRNTCSRSVSGMPGPSSSTATVSVPSALRRDLDMLGEAGGVVDEVGDSALEGMAAERHHQRRALTSMAMSLAPCAWLFTSLRISPISARTISSPRVAFGERHVVLEHGLHLVDVAAHRLELGTVLEQSELQLEAGQHGAEVVAHAGQHDGALLDMALDAVAHLDEGDAPPGAPRARRAGGNRAAAAVPCRNSRPPPTGAGSA